MQMLRMHRLNKSIFNTLAPLSGVALVAGRRVPMGINRSMHSKDKAMNSSAEHLTPHLNWGSARQPEREGLGVAREEAGQQLVHTGRIGRVRLPGSCHLLQVLRSDMRISLQCQRTLSCSDRGISRQLGRGGLGVAREEAGQQLVHASCVRHVWLPGSCHLL